ncbi:MAG TPA: hypothetical protein PJ992_01880 [Arachnia sp.]|nr:hypothetical protein [Arachnia sp.]
MKVQNQLLALIFILLTLVLAFGVLGWGMPILVGALTALLVRIRDLSPKGDGNNIDGGPRWMALLLTPLVGAASAMLGLIAATALVQLKVFGDALVVFGSMQWLGVSCLFRCSLRLSWVLRRPLDGRRNCSTRCWER